jgi:hypothetical protein
MGTLKDDTLHWNLSLRNPSHWRAIHILYYQKLIRRIRITLLIFKLKYV